MLIITVIPLLVAIIGALIYALAANPKIVEIGRIMIFCGLLVTLFGVMGHTVRIGS